MIRARAALAVAACMFLPAALIVIAAANRDEYGPLRLARIDGQTMYVPYNPAEKAEVAKQVVAASPFASAGKPRAKAVEEAYDFGAVEPLATHSHTFRIRNAGTAPLELSDPGSSCKCLAIEVEDRTVPPGRTGRVTVRWTPKPTQDWLYQRATVATNDPAHPRVQFTLTGTTRAVLTAVPHELNAPRVLPHKPVSVTTDVISDEWEQFEIEGVESGLARLDWRVEPTPKDQLSRLQTKSGWRLIITLPAGSLEKSVDEKLVVRARPVTRVGEPAGEALERTIDFHATVLRRVAVYGEGVTERGTIELGNITNSVGCERLFTVKVNDDEPQLSLVDLSAEPAFVEAELLPHERIRKPGYYQLRLRIPPTGGSGVYQGEQEGRLRLVFSHPRIHELELGLDFVLGPADDHRLGHLTSNPRPGS